MLHHEANTPNHALLPVLTTLPPFLPPLLPILTLQWRLSAVRKHAPKLPLKDDNIAFKDLQNITSFGMKMRGVRNVQNLSTPPFCLPLLGLLAWRFAERPPFCQPGTWEGVPPERVAACIAAPAPPDPQAFNGPLYIYIIYFFLLLPR